MVRLFAAMVRAANAVRVASRGCLPARSVTRFVTWDSAITMLVVAAAVNLPLESTVNVPTADALP